MPDYEIHVVTRVPDDPMDPGNLAMAVPVYVDRTLRGDIQQLEPLAALALRAPVFALGEILILGDDGREPHCAMRKPSKWDIGTTRVDDIDAAVELSERVTRGDAS